MDRERELNARGVLLLRDLATLEPGRRELDARDGMRYIVRCETPNLGAALHGVALSRLTATAFGGGVGGRNDRHGLRRFARNARDAERDGGQVGMRPLGRDRIVRETNPMTPANAQS